MIVKLRKKKADPWSGLVMHKNSYHAIGPYYTRTGRYYTGLDNEDAERLGKKLNIDLSTNSAYWDTFNVRVFSEKDYTMIDTSDPLGELQYKFLKNHKDVAGSLTDNKPGATYVLIHEESEAAKENVDARLERIAYQEFDKLSLNQMRKCLRLYGIKSDDISNELVENKLFGLMKGDPKRFMRTWVDNEDREIQFLLEEATSKNIVRKKKTTYYYGGDVLGYTITDAIEYLKDPQNNDVKIGILSQIEGKEKMRTTDLNVESESQSQKLIKEVKKKKTEEKSE